MMSYEFEVWVSQFDPTVIFSAWVVAGVVASVILIAFVGGQSERARQ